MEYRLKSLDLGILRGVIGEHLARSFIRNTLAPKLEEEEKWDHVVFSHNDYKQSLNAFGEKLFSYDRFREDFYSHGFYADRQLLSKYAMVVGILAQNRCTPDGLLLKLQDTGYRRRVEKNILPSNVRLRSRSSKKRGEFRSFQWLKAIWRLLRSNVGAVPS